MEVLLGVLGELVEEEGEEGIDILASSDRVAHGATAVRVTDIDGLVKEDDGSVVVPGVGVVDELKLLVDGSGTELKEETGQRRASRAAVEPKDDGVVLGIVSGLEEPYLRLESVCCDSNSYQLTVEEMLVLLVIVKVTAVLLDLINTELLGVDLLGSELEVVKLAANLSVTLAIGLSPEGLDIGTLDDVIPVAIGLSGNLLGLGRERVLLEGLDSIGDEHGDFIPDSLGLGGDLAKDLLEGLHP